MPLMATFSVTMALLVALVVTIWPELSPAPQTLRPGALFVAIATPVTWILLTIVRTIARGWRRGSSRPYL
jgi:hypothetical protein